MHAISTITLLASLSMGILAQSPGTFDTFTDPACDEGGQGVTVPDQNSSGELEADVLSVKSYIPDCALVIWVNGGNWYPQVIRPGDSNCVELTGPGRQWNVVCQD